MRPRNLIEIGMLCFIASIPLGAELPGVIRGAMIALMVVGILWLRAGGTSSDRSFRPYRLMVPLLLFATAAALSVILSINPGESARRAAFMPVAVAFFFAAQDVLVTPAAWNRLGLTMAWTVVLLSVDGLWQHWHGTSFLTGQAARLDRVTAGAPHPNDLALMPVLLPMALVAFDRTLPTLRRAIGSRLIQLLIIGLCCATLIASQSRNAWLGLAVAVTLWLLLGSRRKWSIAVLIVLALIFCAAIAFDLAGIRARMQSLLALHRDGRLGLWLVGWEMFLQSPIVGKGAHTFGAFYPQLLDQIHIPDWYKPERGAIPWVHNLYLEQACERGLIGLAAFVIVTAAAAMRIVRALKPSPDQLMRPYAAAVAAGLGAFLIMGVFDLTFLKDWVCLMFWLLAGMAAALPNPSQFTPGAGQGIAGRSIQSP